MSELVAVLAEEAGYHWEWLLGASVKVTAWLLLAGIALRLLRNASASVRHAVAAFAAIGVPVVFILNLSPLAEQSGWRPFARSPVSINADELTPAIVNTQDAVAELAADSGLAESNAAPAEVSLGAVVGLPSAIVALWCLGCVVVGWRLLRRLRRLPGSPIVESSVPAPDRLLRIVQREADRLKLKRVPQLALAADAMPMTFGLRRAVVVVPSEAIHWAPEKLTSVLRHELTHVRRRDLWWTLIIEVALLPAWWHPLARALKKQVTELTEQACDDAVISSGSTPVDYASALLSLSPRLVPVRSLGLAIPAISGSESAQVVRFRHVLADDINRRSISPLRLFAFGLLALAIVIPGTLLISCATTEAELETAEAAKQRELEVARASARHPSIAGVPQGAEKLLISVKLFELDITDGTLRQKPGLSDWIEGKHLFLSPDEGFRIFHPQKKGLDLLTAPQIHTRPGQMATLEIGQRVLYPGEDPAGATDIKPGPDADANAAVTKDTQFDFVTTGIEVGIKARPTSNSSILDVELNPSVTELIGFTELDDGRQVPEVRTLERSIRGKFPNGSYLCLGEKVDVQDVQDKVPLLGDIPLLGRLFRSEETWEAKRLIAVQVIVKEEE